VPSQYDVWAVLQWHVDRVRPHGDALCLETERAGLARAQRQRIEREDRLKAGELMEAADVERQFSSIASTVKAKMRALPSAVATQVVGLAASGPGAVQAFLLRQIDAALRELVRAGLAEADRAGK
jgi:phage terminase Nu1 subunit (DNA packaging protein)